MYSIFITVLRTAILMMATQSACVRTGTLDDIRALESAKIGRIAPALDGLRLPEKQQPSEKRRRFHADRDGNAGAQLRRQPTS